MKTSQKMQSVTLSNLLSQGSDVTADSRKLASAEMFEPHLVSVLCVHAYDYSLDLAIHMKQNPVDMRESNSSDVM